MSSGHQTSPTALGCGLITATANHTATAATAIAPMSTKTERPLRAPVIAHHPASHSREEVFRCVATTAGAEPMSRASRVHVRAREEVSRCVATTAGVDPLNAVALIARPYVRSGVPARVGWPPLAPPVSA